MAIVSPEMSRTGRRVVRQASRPARLGSARPRSGLLPTETLTGT